jgi:hypothetical protein
MNFSIFDQMRNSIEKSGHVLSCLTPRKTRSRMTVTAMAPTMPQCAEMAAAEKLQDLGTPHDDARELAKEIAARVINAIEEHGHWAADWHEYYEWLSPCDK